jgi:predicted membrane protein
MKFVVEFIDAFIEPFTFILGPIAVMILVAVCLMKHQSDKKKEKSKANDCPDIPYPKILPNPNLTQIPVDTKK